MNGAMTEKANQPKLFEDAAAVLLEDFKKNFRDEPSSFVWIGAESKNPDHLTIWRQLPKPMQAILHKTFKSKGFYIRKKAIRSIVGEHDASFANANFFGKDLFGSFPKARKLVRFIEKWWKKLIALEKMQIVIRTPEVLFTNMISNSIKLMQEGMSLDEVIAVQYEGLVAAVDYIRTDMKKRKLELKQRAGETGLDGEIANLNAELVRNPVSY
jgi:hypothetical protein